MKKFTSNFNLLVLVLPLFIQKCQTATLPGMTHVTLMMVADQLMGVLKRF